MKNQIIERISNLIDGGKSQDEILKILSMVFNIPDSIIVIRAVYKISLGEAKEVVASCPYWQNEHQSNEILHETLETIFLDSLNNSINVIFPYKYSGMWVFDDKRVGLVQEPFVGGADTIIDRLVEVIPNANQGFALIFSGEYFPDATISLNWRRSDGSGNWYYSNELDMEGWLCPALLKYFSETPKNIFIKVKAKQ